MSDLLERLRRVREHHKVPDIGRMVSNWYVNPDGPEAADEIARLQAVLDAGRERAVTIIEDAIYPREAKGVAWQILRALGG